MGRTRAPLGGHLTVLAELVAEQNDATLAEYAARFAARTCLRRSVAVICKALQQLGWVRKQKPSAPVIGFGLLTIPFTRSANLSERRWNSKCSATVRVIDDREIEAVFMADSQHRFAVELVEHA